MKHHIEYQTFLTFLILKIKVFSLAKLFVKTFYTDIYIFKHIQLMTVRQNVEIKKKNDFNHFVQPYF